ncbi:serine hydrolase [Actomonas aquatica]|uniref:Beta-lactamase n=1 Tax=Actomonas aquatica TaxID=2866162 RepID=A0ABZ1CCF5_9BACT|nr:serine hydrolase [Opitutus sp. WL0086]WRQ89354.1 serine hydrolase [Opitutus sp. WL0086]
MKNWILKTTLALATAVTGWSAETIDTTGLQAELASWAGDKPGAVIALVIDGDARGIATAGRWSAEDERLADEHTLFEIGSISKVFTALLTATAVQDGVLAWDEPVAGGFAPSTITYADLATHMSGLPRLPTDFPSLDLVDPYAISDVAEVQRAFAANAPEAEQGTWAYSNLGAAVLGQAVAAELKMSYEDAVRARVLQPLGMTETVMSGLEKLDTAKLAPGFNSAGPAARWRFDGYAPAGAWISSAADMERFMRGLMAAEEPWASTMEVQAETDGPYAMGYGWMIHDVAGESVKGHAGGTGGYRSFVGIQPATGRGIVVLGARDEDVAGIGLGWLQGLFDGAVKSTDEPVVLEDFVGEYPLAPQFVISVFLQDGQLRAQATGQPSFGLKAAGADAFAFEGVAARLSFERDDDGAVTGLVLHQGGRDMPAPRRDASEVKQETKGIELAPAQLEGLAGDYELAPTLIVSITVDRGQVFAQLTGQARYPVYAKAPDRFFYDVVEAELEFQRDETGAVTGLVLHQAGQHIPGKKR